MNNDTCRRHQLCKITKKLLVYDKISPLIVTGIFSEYRTKQGNRINYDSQSSGNKWYNIYEILETLDDDTLLLLYCI